jgi:hypothetical protein
MTTATATRTNGAASELQQAIESEQTIAQDAEAIRASKPLDAALLGKLMPLLRKPIPSGFIVTTGVVTGKPYESTGVKSMQVQVNRMDAVLGATNWGWRTEWFDDGKVAEVTVWIGPEDAPLVRRAARGGVKQASTQGNLYKGSETNAGKLAFARVGPGWEVYVGAADLDPDVSEDAAKAQAGAPDEPADPKPSAQAVEAVEKIIAAADLSDHLEAKLRGFGVKSMADLSRDQLMILHAWATGTENGGGS